MNLEDLEISRTFITAERYHDFSAGHRVAGHENKCALLHGHNYRVTFRVRALRRDSLGRVMDFGVMKTKLCQWLEDNWDHKFLLWERDEIRLEHILGEDHLVGMKSVVRLPFNPTAENMAHYLLHVIGPNQLSDTGVELVQVVVEETRKCSATATLKPQQRRKK